VAELTFRPMTRDDLPLLHAWLQRPHVKRWWDDHATPEQVEAHYGPALDGAEPTDHYLALEDGAPIGFFETYLYASYPADAAAVSAEPGSAGVDLFIADEERTGKGLGSTLLRQFADEVVLANPKVTHVVSEPEAANIASVRAFEKAGFRVEREFDNALDGKRHAFLRKDRSRPEAASPHALERT
jgi:RimJ/RimL family protein N-acetyltransferase